MADRHDLLSVIKLSAVAVADAEAKEDDDDAAVYEGTDEFGAKEEEKEPVLLLL